MPENPAGEAERQPLDVFGVLAVTVEQMASIAWQKMGLQPDFVTGKIEKDMAQCKTAVDATAALAALLEPSLDESDRRQLQNLVRDLRMNFMEKSQ